MVKKILLVIPLTLVIAGSIYNDSQSSVTNLGENKTEFKKITLAKDESQPGPYVIILKS
ncbi:hypothetical protein ACIQYG_22040 [Peribacillus sp. NPDC096622]|uniref:hypothetical protein n=1 Tax=Peribacillus sp. NPDC096622 TaxID=3364396 RepID=UPI003804086E